MKKIITDICASGHWYGETPQNIVNSMELILGVKFPEDYKTFIHCFGSGSKNGVEIAGYHPKIASDMNVIGKTVYQIRDFFYYPKDLIFISDTGDGGQICFDSKNWKIKLVYKRSGKAEIQDYADDFVDFLQKSFQ